ncbi:MAG TPA: hypothetical protein VHB72_01855 [Candidatus Saccharimonadales bacterium]|nr:hypothetical protein [Candidatus Saccharimonadales bacterium]
MHERTGSSNNEVLRMQQALARATEAVVGQPGADPLEVFPDPKSEERREDVAFDAGNLTEEQEAHFRVAMADLGPGRERSVGAFETGLARGYNAVLEGGQAHKMMAELELVLEDHVQPRQIIITGGVRKLGDKERELTARLLGMEIDEVGETEFDVACQVIKRHPKFEPFPEGARGFLGGDPSKFNAAYDLSEEPDSYLIGPKHGSDQFVQLGTIGGGKPAIAMRVDRFPDPAHPDDPSKYIQPSNAQKMGFASGFLGASQEIEYGPAVKNVALVTSATYEPSCTLAALEAEERVGDIHGHVLAYGTVALAAIKGEDPKQPGLNQLAGEAHKVAKMLRNRESQ